jgi:hypothetical protein
MHVNVECFEASAQWVFVTCCQPGHDVMKQTNTWDGACAINTRAHDHFETKTTGKFSKEVR